MYLRHFPERNKTIEWVSIMQHYGAPTRLLDWTYSPFVAAFFALETLNNESAVYDIDARKLDQINREKVRIDDDLKERIFQKDIGDLFVFSYEPEFQNDRLIAQQGLFLVPSTINIKIEEIINKIPDYSEAVIKYILVFNNKEIIRCSYSVPVK